MWITYSEHHLAVMLLMKSCVFKPACVKRPTPRKALGCQAIKLAKSLIHSESVHKPRKGQNLGDIVCTAVCVQAATHPVSLILS